MRTADQPIRISLFAPDGRMGQAIAAAVAENPAFEIDKDHGDVLVDFSAPAALQASLDRAIPAGIPILVGTTGLDDLRRPADRRCGQGDRRAARGEHVARRRPARRPRRAGGERARAPNGTSRSPRRTTATRPTRRRAPRSCSGRRRREAAARRCKPSAGATAPDSTREPGAIGFASLRGGTVAGDHDVMFLGPDERLILSHRAESRMIFARGALAAARFLFGRPAGLYTMRDVIGAL